MTDRAEVVAKIEAKIDVLIWPTKRSALDLTKPLLGQMGIDGLDLIEFAMAVEEEFFGDDTTVAIEPQSDLTVDKIADAVIAQLAKREAART